MLEGKNYKQIKKYLIMIKKCIINISLKLKTIKFSIKLKTFLNKH
jgi:hypothetical protein